MADYSIRDIARMAGVSVGTVSRILNNAENVDEGIRQRTMEVIRQVNYRSGRRGRRAESRPAAFTAPERIRNLALISPGMGSAWKSNELWASYMAGIETACQERRCRLTMYMADTKRDDIIREIVRNADGILIKMEDTLPDYLKELITLLPAVGFGAAHTFDPLPQVIVDNNAGGVIATEQLLQHGHRRIAFVNHEACNEIFIARSNGYLEVVKSEGSFRPEYLIEFSARTRADGYAAEPEQAPPDMSGVLEKLLSLPERPTAVVFANDWAAFGFLTACSARGIRIPDEFSIAGMDDSGNLCTLLKPALSSVAMPFNQVSHFAACTLCDLIDGIGAHQRNTSSVIRIPGVLKQRDSIRTIQ
ncbi:MAG: LacI family DNA-binding transcriptional regulator [Lentisphaeria bacterium]|nr:LacI family DNA-binding transcriptional regulator [Lentisphaeria bacterium]